jgi:hypothetical protein
MADPRNPCRSTGKRSDVSSWVFVGAVPEDIVGAAGGGAGVGVCQKITCLWKRTFSLQYSCSCNGKTTDDVVVPGNVEYYKVTITDSFPTISLSLGLPVPGVLGAIADALGVGIDLAHFWAPGAEAAVNARAAQDAPADSADATPGTKSKLKPAPVAVCGSVIDFGGGNVAPWPAPGTPPATPADDRTELECGKATSFTRHSYGWGTGADPAEAQANAETRLRFLTPSDIQRFVDDYKCRAPCIMKLPYQVTYTAMSIAPYNNPPPQVASTSFWCFASWEWTVTLDCIQG